MSLYRNQLEAWLKTIDVKAGMVADVGGGSRPVKGRTRSWEAADFIVFDKGIEQFSPGAGIPVPFDLDKDEFRRLAIGAPYRGRFDTVFCLEVFEYVHDPVTAVKNLFELLKPGGTLYASFPFLYPIHNPAGIDCLRYTHEGILELLQGAGFRNINVDPRRATAGRDALQEFIRLEGMHARKDGTWDHIGYLVTATKPEEIQ